MILSHFSTDCSLPVSIGTSTSTHYMLVMGGRALFKDWWSLLSLSALQDLIDVSNGSFNERLRKAVKLGKKHVKQCPVSLLMPPLTTPIIIPTVIAVLSERLHM